MGRRMQQRLNSQQVEDYLKFLEENKDYIRKYFPALTKTQARFTNVVYAICENFGKARIEDIAQLWDCSPRTVKNAIRIVKIKALPFRVSERTKCRRLEAVGEGQYNPQFGKMTETALQSKLSRDKKRFA